MKRPAAVLPKREIRPLTTRARVRLFGPIHELWGALAIVGIRDRLRCPDCRAVGTWKPHGTWWGRWVDKDRPVRRWMCKWCGRYEGPEGLLSVFPDPARGCWVAPYPVDLESPEEPGPTPAVVLNRELPNVWPWWG